MSDSIEMNKNYIKSPVYIIKLLIVSTKLSYLFLLFYKTLYQTVYKVTTWEYYFVVLTLQQVFIIMYNRGQM